MKNGCFFLFILFSQHVTAQAQEKAATERQLMKEYVFCRCIKSSIDTFTKKDSLEVSMRELREDLESHGISSRSLFKNLDSAANSQVAFMLSHRNDTLYKAEGALGRYDYINFCRNYYKSIELDKFIRSFKRREYYVKEMDNDHYKP